MSITKLNSKKVIKYTVPAVASAVLLWNVFKPNSENLINQSNTIPNSSVEYIDKNKTTKKENISENFQVSFESVFSKKGLVSAKILEDASYRAAKLLLSSKTPNPSFQEIAIGKLENGEFKNIQIVSCERPNPSSKTYFNANNTKFELKRHNKNVDPGGLSSEMIITPIDNAHLNERWFVLVAKIPVSHSRLGSSSRIFYPYNHELNSGDINRQALSYLNSVEKTARSAINVYASESTKNKLSKVPSNINTLIALLEQTSASSLNNSQKIMSDLSRIFHHIFLYRNLSKFYVVSSAKAYGFYQFIQSTEKSLIKKYTNEPLKVFESWAKDNGYVNLKDLNPKNTIFDTYFSSILAFYHHIDILDVLNNRLKKNGLASNEYVHVNDVQSTCAIASGYNGGSNAIFKHIMQHKSNWHEDVYTHGSDIIRSLDKYPNENIGYITKAYVVKNAFNKDKIQLFL